MGEVKTVVEKTLCTEQEAVDALKENDGQVMDAIMLITDAQRNRMEEANSLLSPGENNNNNNDNNNNNNNPSDSQGKNDGTGGSDSLFAELARAAAGFSEGDDANRDRPLGLDGRLEQREKRSRRRAEGKRMSRWKLEGTDAKWIPGSEKKKNIDEDDEPWFTG